MTAPALRVVRLGKRYQLGMRERAGQTFREAVAAAAAAPVRRFRRLSGGDREGPEAFWALRDVSFDVEPGEVVGVIGRNGAGKSTLLKILSRITEPTEGHAEIRGRVASLLEVGTGFHNELTGRENVYLNGAILGMGKREIDRKFDEIVDFAGTERFLDTAIKHYSSGMKVRLAFAVAAHLEPEILIIDEVLAVGDQEFQNRCLGKMNEVARSGRTVLFVSHNMAAVEALCTSAVLMARGAVALRGGVGETIRRYLSSATHDGGTDVTLGGHPCRVAGHSPVFRRFRVTDDGGRVLTALVLGQPAVFDVELDSDRPLRGAGVGIHFYGPTGQRVVSFHTYSQSRQPVDISGPTRLTCRVPRWPLLPGRYTVVLGLGCGADSIDRIDPATSLDVVSGDYYGTGRSVRAGDGVFAPEAEWTVTA